jgi:translation initiation factor 5
MALINITGTRPSSDEHFRYTMPALNIRQEGSGNGVKTVITNIDKISDALERPVSLLVRYFGIELSAQSRLQDDPIRLIINGSFTHKQLLDTLNTFIDSFVLCPNCHLPETLLTIKKHTLRHKCKSCGCTDPITIEHKLIKYILKLFGK